MHITCMSAISETQNLLSWHKREPLRTYWQHSDQLNPWRRYKTWGDCQHEDWYALMSHSWAKQISTTPSLCCFKPIHKPGMPPHTRPVSTLPGHPSILDLPVQYMLSYPYYCDMSLGVIAGKLEVTRPDLHQFLWERLSPLSWKFARNHRGFSSFCAWRMRRSLLQGDLWCEGDATRPHPSVREGRMNWGWSRIQQVDTHVSAALFCPVL